MSARAQVEKDTRLERLRGQELGVLRRRGEYEHQQTKKAVAQLELSLEGHAADVGTLSSQLNEAQVCVCVCACVCARARVRARVRACVSL